MNKNLKKVISAVAALSLSASSIAALAVNFPDVEDTASYAQAVQELSALDVISGFEDGTFKPDELVTRAQISKMIVDALAEGKEAAASSVSSKFSDVNAAGEGGHWATGYINQGTTDGWISGYSDTEFGPDDNVTYVQAQKMLVAALGYDIYATAKGGWPAGYKLYASSLDITKGVQGVTSDDQQLTRAQVAQMIDNAMGAPLCVIDDWKIEWNGTKTPVLDVKDGEGKDYQTLFTKYHDAYKVYGRVTATSRTETGLDTAKVMFRVEKADNFDDEYVKAADEREADEMYYGDTNAVNMLRTYAQALVQKDDDDEFHIISIVPAAANKTVDLLAEDVDTSKSVPGEVLYFYPTGTSRGSVKYQLNTEKGVSYFVNGVEVTSVPLDKDYATVDEYIYNEFIVDNDTALVTLQQETDPGSTNASSKYNVIMVTTFATAVVEEVTDKADTTRINFKDNSAGIGASYMELEKDNDNKIYTFKLNGEAIDPADLQEYDVLTISYEIGNFRDSDFYDVTVSRDTAEGKYTGKSSDNKKFTIGGTQYKAASGMSPKFETSTEYTLYLDAFGRIAYTDEIQNSKKYGILKKVYQKTNDDWVAEVITKEGTIEEFTVDDEDGATYKALVKSTAQADALTVYPQQVVEYKTSSAGKLTIKSTVSNTDSTVATVGSEAECNSQTFKASTGKLGSIKVSEATTIIDISNVSDKKDDFKVISVDNLKDGSYYTAFGYDKSSSTGVCGLVLITSGIGDFDSTSQLAVFVESGSDSDEDGNDVDTMTLLVNGEKTTLFVDDDATDVNVKDFAEGDALIFKTNSSNEINGVIKVFANKGALNKESFSDFRDSVFAGDAVLSTNDWSQLCDGEQDNVEVKFGAVVKDGNNYVLAPVHTDGDVAYVDFSDDNNIDLTVSGAKTYAYNYHYKWSNSARLILDNGMAVTSKVKAAYKGGDDSNNIYYIGDDQVKDDVVFAVVRTFDNDEVQEAYFILDN